MQHAPLSEPLISPRVKVEADACVRGLTAEVPSTGKSKYTYRPHGVPWYTRRKSTTRCRQSFRNQVKEWTIHSLQPVTGGASITPLDVLSHNSCVLLEQVETKDHTPTQTFQVVPHNKNVGFQVNLRPKPVRKSQFHRDQAESSNLDSLSYGLPYSTARYEGT